MWWDLLSWDEALSSSGGAGFISEPQPINHRPVGSGFLHRAGRFSNRRNPSQSAIEPVGLGFPRPCGAVLRLGNPSLAGIDASAVGVSTRCGAVLNRRYPSQPAIEPIGLDFHTVRGGMHPGEFGFGPQVVGFVVTSRNLWAGDGDISSPGGASFIFWPQPIGHGPMGLWFSHRVGR